MYKYLALILILTGVITGCNGNKPETPDTPAKPDTNKPATINIDTAGLPTFSGQNAFDHVAKQVAFGPRNPGSEGHKQTLEYLVSEMSKYTPNVTRQSWTQPGYGETLQLTNVIASFNPASSQRILLCAHWDTRPRAEQDPDTALQKKPFLGANDAGSGCGVLLELARILKDHPPTIGIDIVLLDGEDYGHESDLDYYFLGSRYFSKNLPPGFRPAFGVLLDLVGDHNASFPKEGYSMDHAEAVVNSLWDAAQKLGLHQFAQRRGPTISDDHLPLNEAGIQTVDIIDADMVGNRTNDPNRNYWHTHGDTMDKISSKTLEAVGRLLVYTIYRLAPAAGHAS